MDSLSTTLSEIEQLMHSIINQPNEPLYTVVDQRNGVMQIIPSRLADTITKTLRSHFRLLQGQFPIHELNPYVDVFIRQALYCNLLENIQQIDALRKSNDLYQVGVDYEIMVKLMTGIQTYVNQIRQAVSTDAFKSKIRNAVRTSKKNQEGMISLIDSLIARYARLLVVRLDIGYQQGNAITCEEDIPIKFREAKCDFERLLNNAKKNQLFNHVVGKIWKLEYGPDKGFHYHLIFFFDGSQVREDVTLAKLIGDYWVNAITNNRGTYWNCNANKNHYNQCGIGMIHYSDLEKIENLKQTAEYLVKVDHYARILTPDGSHTFGRSNIPPLTDRLGRPRSFDSEQDF
ncbi:inovirus-type Gp2 protein [Methylotuvimicrobium buryatense]|nr:inovirus-type Gp2 protein [Methylotuvimicrobium buryatense]